jgi:hypothetical protein
MTDSTGASALFETWRKQLEESTQAWTRMIGQTTTPTSPPDPVAFWRPVLDQGLQNWARLFAQTPASPDLMAQWKQFLDQWTEAWSKVLGQAMGTEAFAQWMGRSLDQWLAAQGPVRKVADQSIDAALQALNLASRTQVAGVARQLGDLEDRIERLEDVITALARRLDADRGEGQRARSAEGAA